MKEKEKILNDAVLVFLIQDKKVLLATKMKKIGKGKLNGYGGGIEEGETPLIAAIRELEEETRNSGKKGILVASEDMCKVAMMNFHNTTEEGITFVCKVHVFLAANWNGEILSTEDLENPTWYSIDNIPTEKMMPADKVWIPLALSGKKIIGKAKYSPRQEALIGEVEIEEVESFSE